MHSANGGNNGHPQSRRLIQEMASNGTSFYLRLSTMSIKSLAHVCIKTTDLDATTDFYCGALDMKRLFDFTKKGKVIGFYMKAANETFIEVFLADEAEKIGKQVLNHFC